MKAFKKLAFVIIGPLLSLALISCSGGGGGGGNSSSTVMSGRVVDGYVAGATVTAYQVNADGTLGAQIGTPVTTDTNGNYTLNLGTYSGPVYLSSQGGTYVDAATNTTIDLSNSGMILSAIVPNASGNATAQVNPLTTMAAGVALTLARQGTPVATAADNANTLIQNYFALTSSILNTDIVSLNSPTCTTVTGFTQANADVSAILDGISLLALNNGVNTPNLVQALIQDVTSDGKFNGLAGLTTISLPLSSGTGTISLSSIEGTALTNLASAISSFMTNTSTLNICQANVDSNVISALSNTSIIPTPAPTAPTLAQPIAGNGSVVLNWSTVTGATSYNVYMATATGVTGTSAQLPGFRSVPNVPNPADISTGPTNTYYFVVTAASGTYPYPYENESVPSNEVSSFVQATALPALWAQTVSAGTGTSASEFNGVSVASDGSVYAAGYIFGTGSYNFGPAVMSQGTCTSSNVALVKYNSSGAAQWARTVTAGSDQSSFSSVAVASDGSVYAAGYIYGNDTYNFGNGVISQGTSTSSNVVLVKYNGSTGLAQWAQTVSAVTGTGTYVSGFNGVAVASDGSIYAAGNIHGTNTYNFGNGVTARGASNGYNTVLVKYNGSTGLAQWAQTVTATSLTGVIDESSFSSVSVASDGSGSVYTAGYIAGNNTTTTFNFGNSVTATGVYSTGNIVLVKYDSTGVAQWAQTVTAGTGDSFFTSLSSVAPDGSVYAAGYIQGNGTYNFSPSVTATGTLTDGINTVLVKYNNLGVAQWAQTMAAASNSSIFFGVSAASDGSVYGAGYIAGTGTFDFGNGMTATGTSDSNIVLVKYDSSGLASWAQTVSAGPSNSTFTCVFASGGYVYAAGDIEGTGTYNFGNNNSATGTYIGSNMVLVAY